MKLAFLKILKKDSEYFYLALKFFMLSCAGVSVGCAAFIIFARYCFYEKSSQMVLDTATYLYEQGTENLKDPVLNSGQDLIEVTIFSQDIHTKENYVDPSDLALTEKKALLKVKGFKRKIADNVYELRFDTLQ